MKLPSPWSTIDPRLLPLFIVIARTGSMSRAATQLHLSRSVVSRQLARLEEDLGVRLVQRTTRRLSLTEVGELVLRQAELAERALDGVTQLASSYRQQVRGRLRVTCSMALGRRHVAPALPELVAPYPELEVSLHLEDRLVDLIAEDVDVALRVSHLPDSSLVARKLADNPRVLVAAPSYLGRRRSPEHPEQLAEHNCLLYVQGNRVFDEWRLMGPEGLLKVRVRGQMQVNDGQALIDAAVAGTGILNVDRLLLRDELESGALVEILPGHPPEPGPPIYAVYPAREFLPSKTALFIDFLERRFKSKEPGPRASFPRHR
jgi:DNA-binding transcriptional LysR family regulator